MEKALRSTTVAKLAIAAERAGFSLEQMIEFLNAGITVETLLHLIALRLTTDLPAAGRGSLFGNRNNFH